METHPKNYSHQLENIPDLAFALLYLEFLPPNCCTGDQVVGERIGSPAMHGGNLPVKLLLAREIGSRVWTKSQVQKEFVVLGCCTGDQDSGGWNSGTD
jgi:hypothetical protein